jgi:tRNA-intron endonuclease
LEVNSVITGKLLGNRVLVEDQKSVEKLRNKAYGTVEEGILYLDAIEAAYLVERGTLEMEGGEDLQKIIQRERSLAVQFFVYRDLRERGLIVKAGLKYGAHFRVYRGGMDDHAEYLVHAVDEKENLQSYDLVKAARMAHTVNKKMILAFIDMENDITYIEAGRIRL